ncbi:hypothetical protein ACOSQ4_023065 [Xanthoceras sorbifolium]
MKFCFLMRNRGGLPRAINQIRNFREALNDCSLGDLGFKGPPFTWCNGRTGASLVQERIDRGVCNVEWLDLFPSSSVDHLDYWRSDHRPLLVNILSSLSANTGPTRGPRRFMFEECWASEEGCAAIIEQNWCNQICRDSVASVLSNISDCTSKLQIWNTSNRARLRWDIAAKRRELYRNNEINNATDWQLL